MMRRLLSTAKNSDQRQAISDQFLLNAARCSLLARPAYIFLLSVLFIAAIAVSIVGSYLLLSIASLQNGLALENATESIELAQSCGERALHSLLTDNTYPGGETVMLLGGTCTISAVGGYGNQDRVLCVEGVSGSNTRRLEIFIIRLLPSIRISSWREVATITACSS